MRIIEQLSKYNDNLTLSQVKSLILEEHQKEKQREERGFQEIKNKFNNTYIKRINDGLLGKTIEIFQIKEIIRRERTTDWDWSYYFKGNKIVFSKRDINYININGNLTHWTFSKEELDNAEIISESQYISYLKQYKEIEEKLKNLIN